MTQKNGSLMMWKQFFVAAFALTIFVFPGAGQAQDQAPQPQPAAQVVPTAPVAETIQTINPNTINPLVFTFWENSAIAEALAARNKPGAKKRIPDTTQQEDKVKPPPEEREIKLGGILYVSGDDWIVWLNGKRVTPKALPKEVLDLKVHKQYVEIRWFDEYSNQIFPIRLRPHERFNIDSRVFIPG